MQYERLCSVKPRMGQVKNERLCSFHNHLAGLFLGAQCAMQHLCALHHLCLINRQSVWRGVKKWALHSNYRIQVAESNTKKFERITYFRKFDAG